MENLGAPDKLAQAWGEKEGDKQIAREGNEDKSNHFDVLELLLKIVKQSEICALAESKRYGFKFQFWSWRSMAR